MTDAAQTGFVDPTKLSFAQFGELGRSGPVHMLNLVKFRKQAIGEDDTIASGAEACNSHARESGPVFQRLGGRQDWVGTPELMLIGPESEVWDLAFIAEYPDKDAFVAMVREPDYRKVVRHRRVAVADSHLIRMDPGVPGAHFSMMCSMRAEGEPVSLLNESRRAASFLQA